MQSFLYAKYVVLISELACSLLLVLFEFSL